MDNWNRICFFSDYILSRKKEMYNRVPYEFMNFAYNFRNKIFFVEILYVNMIIILFGIILLSSICLMLYNKMSARLYNEAENLCSCQ